MQLRPRRRVEIVNETAAPPKTVQRVLCACDVHSSADSSPYSCCICLSKLVFDPDVAPAWAQCFKCSNVYHMRCIETLARSDEDKIVCPLCKHEHPSDTLEDWYPEDLVEKLRGDDDDYQVEGEEVEPSDRVLRSAKRQRPGA